MGYNPREEPSVFGRAVNDIYITMSSMTDEIVSQCPPSDTLKHTVSNMISDAAAEALSRFRAENRRKTNG